jgi:recombination protein RecR
VVPVIPSAARDPHRKNPDRSIHGIPRFARNDGTGPATQQAPSKRQLGQAKNNCNEQLAAIPHRQPTTNNRQPFVTAPPLANLINELTRLPGIGGKSAARLAYHILKRPAAEAESLASAILDVKTKIFRCPQCNNLTDVDPCAICADPRRDGSAICVVEEAFNIQTVESTRDFHGLYHVLLGALSPLKGIGPDDIDVAGLLRRVKSENVREAIIATNPNVEGEATALYIAQQLRPLGIRTTRLGFGLPVGGDLEYADQVTMAKALEGRREI